MIYALIICILTLHNAGPQEVWLFYYNPAGKVTINSEYCRRDAPTISECFLPEGESTLELQVVAPCHMASVPVLISEDWRGPRRQVYWTQIPNSAPCVHRQILPVVWSNYQPASKEK